MPHAAPSAAELPNAEPSARRPQRVLSLDIFRGLTLALMIFVNEVAEIKGLPWWTYHAPGRVDVMTYVDMVFPAFLFILGMAIPLAIGGRVRRGASSQQLALHVTLRSAALVVLGVILANAGAGDAERMHGVGPYLWPVLALAAAMLVWFDYPKATGTRERRWQGALRLFGLAALVLLAALFRRTGRDGAEQWLSYEYPEILGLIGYTYFVGALCYLLTRRLRWAPAGWFLLFTAFNCLASAKVIRVRLPWWQWPVANGSMLSLTMAGVVLTTIFFLEPRLHTFRRKAAAALGLGVAAAVAAGLLAPLGISKIRATPTWALATVAVCCGAFTLLYWICDERGWTRWAAPVRSAGSNTLLTYLLPDLWFYALNLLGIHWFSEHLARGWPGVARAVVFTAVMLGLSAGLTRARIRLQL